MEKLHITLLFVNIRSERLAQWYSMRIDKKNS